MFQVCARDIYVGGFMGINRVAANAANRSLWLHIHFSKRPGIARTAAAVMACCGAAFAAFAAEETGSQDGIPGPSIATSLPGKGDPGGARAGLAAKGITYGINYIGETLGNASGGQKQGAIYEGRLEGVLDADMEKLWGLKGLSLHTNAYQIHGAGLSRESLGNLLAVSSIEALPSTRLFELWLEQKIGQAVSVRFGQLAADSEFFVSANGANFINGTFGWPGILAADLPSGGPAYPLATPGVRFKFEPTSNFVFLAALFNGDPAGPGENDPQERNRYGTSFRVNDPPFLIAEAQYKYHREKNASGLPGTIKFGGWDHTGDFSDQRFDAAGLSLASPDSTGVAANLRGDCGLYAVIDQQIYRLPGSDAEKGINLFGRISGSPSDRNLIDFYADGGLVFSGFISSRPGDSFGAGFAYAGISGRASPLGQDANAFGGAALTVRDFESALEVYYKAEVLPGLVVQPDFQYIWHPGGNVADNNGAPAAEAAIGGVRVSINY